MNLPQLKAEVESAVDAVMSTWIKTKTDMGVHPKDAAFAGGSALHAVGHTMLREGLGVDPEIARAAHDAYVNTMVQNRNT